MEPETISTPRPDPTLLTTQQLKFAVAEVKENLGDKITWLRELHEEKFRGVATQFENSSTALSAALSAQKEAGNKSEASFAKQIEFMNITINDLKGRLDRGEGKFSGIGNAWGIVVAVVMALVAIGALVAMVVKP